MIFQLIARFRGWLMPYPFWIDDLGRRGEYLARRAWHRRGYHLLARNWRHGRGELDVVMANPERVVFLEVKTRTQTGSEPIRIGDTLGLEQERRLLGLAETWLRTWPVPVPWTFQLVLVRFTGKRRFEIEQARIQ